MKLDERVVAAMERVGFVFPQQRTSMSASHLCNHDWFGSFELLQVTGVVRLQADPILCANARAAAVAERAAKIAEQKEQARKMHEAHAAREKEKQARIAASLEAEEEQKKKKAKTDGSGSSCAMGEEAEEAEEENEYPASMLGSGDD